MKDYRVIYSVYYKKWTVWLLEYDNAHLLKKFNTREEAEKYKIERMMEDERIEGNRI